MFAQEILLFDCQSSEKSPYKKYQEKIMPHQRIMVSLEGSIVETRGRLSGQWAGAGWFFLACRAGCKYQIVGLVLLWQFQWDCII